MQDLFDFAFIPNLDNFIEELASLAEPEFNNWEYKNAYDDKPKPILRNYLNYTFRRLKEEKKVLLNSKACFISCSAFKRR
jgi:hypothetical protein